MTEHELQNDIRVELSKSGGIVLRMNAGQLWQGTRVYKPELGGWILTHLRAVEGVPMGCSDLLFLGEGGKAAFIEVKSAKGRTRESQERFIERVKELGFQAGFARSVDDALKIVGGE